MAQLTVSLSAIAANYQILQQSAYADVAAVVKADGYGLGANAIAQHLRNMGCTDFFVATAQEGAALAQALEDANIYVFEGATDQSAALLCQHDLIPVLNTAQQCALWRSTARAAALHVDSGLNRLGIPLKEVVGCAEGLNLTYLISHLARADEQDQSYTQQQVRVCQEVFGQLSQTQQSLRLSITNSAGMLRSVGPEHLGRAGIGLYGGNPFQRGANPMHPVANLYAQVLQVRELKAGETVGYNGTHVAQANTSIAVIDVGYADGIPRLLSNRGYAVAAGQQCPMVGRISMDTLAVEIGDAPVVEGDMVELFGGQIDIESVATHAQTLSYEILTGLGARLLRRYTNDSVT